MFSQSIHKLCGVLLPLYRVYLSLFVFLFFSLTADSQFAPVAGYAGTTAIPADSTAFIGWATGCVIHRGYRDIAVPDSGFASVGDSSSAIGPAIQNGVVSLGDGGEAILTFASPVVNGEGYDFAVFENGFNSGSPGIAFLELAFVEVSSDGIHYVRFPTTDNVQDSIQIGLGGMDGSKLDNLAGKYVYGYGTPYDLDQLKDSVGLDVNHITHVKIVDVVGSIDTAFGTRDSHGRIINDPYPTNYASSGFDLDAVGVIHQIGSNAVSQMQQAKVIKVYPNPFASSLYLSEAPTGSRAKICDLSSRVLVDQFFDRSGIINTDQLPSGMYTLNIVNGESILSQLIVKE